MKNSIVSFCILVLLSLPALQAQTGKGKFLVGVSSTLSLIGRGSDLMTFDNSSTKIKGGNGQGDGPDKQTSFGLSPKAGYFLTNNIALGLDLSLLNTKNKWSSADYSSTDKSGISATGPFLRIYISTGKIHPFFEASCLFGSMTEKHSSTGGSSTYKTSLSEFGGGAGMTIPVGDKSGFDVMFVYNSFTAMAKDNNPDNVKSVTGSFGIKLGFLVFPGKQKE